MIKSDNFYNNANCPIKEECPFYRKGTFETREVIWYIEKCLSGGDGCGLKRNYDITERLKELGK